MHCTSYHTIQLKGKLMNQTLEKMVRKQFRARFWPVCADLFLWVLP